jgi:hypothetical protein
MDEFNKVLKFLTEEIREVQVRRLTILLYIRGINQKMSKGALYVKSGCNCF